MTKTVGPSDSHSCDTSFTNVEAMNAIEQILKNHQEINNSGLEARVIYDKLCSFNPVFKAQEGCKKKYRKVTRYLSRYSYDDRWAIEQKKLSRTQALYYYKAPKPETKEIVATLQTGPKTSSDLRSFFDKDEPVCIHNIHIVLQNVNVPERLIKMEEEELDFMDYTEKIKLKFYPHTIDIYYKCSEYKKALDHIKFLSFFSTLKAFIRGIGYGDDEISKLYFTEFDLNVDLDNIRMDGTSFLSMQAFENLVLAVYNKGEGLRKEARPSFKPQEHEKERIGEYQVLGLLRNTVDLMKFRKDAAAVSVTANQLETALTVFGNNTHKYFTKFSDTIDDYRDVVETTDSLLNEVKEETKTTQEIVANSITGIAKSTETIADNTTVQTDLLTEINFKQEEIKQELYDSTDLQLLEVSKLGSSIERKFDYTTSIVQSDNIEQTKILHDITEMLKDRPSRPETIKLNKLSQSAKEIVAILQTGPKTSSDLRKKLHVSAARISQILNEIDECDEYTITREKLRDGSRGRPKQLYKLRNDEK